MWVWYRSDESLWFNILQEVSNYRPFFTFGFCIYVVIIFYFLYFLGSMWIDLFFISIFFPHLSLFVSFNSFMVASTIKSTKTKHYNGLLTKNLKVVAYFIMMKHYKNRKMILIQWKFLDFFKPFGLCVSFSLFYYFLIFLVICFIFMFFPLSIAF
jgi:hypothetical protein